MSTSLVEHIDYYFNEDGMMVLTEKYHQKRGYCCGNGCRHCPYDYEAVPSEKKGLLKKNRQENKNRPG